jgi:hypothetical protein
MTVLARIAEVRFRGWFMAIAADIGQLPKVRPPVAVEALGLGVIPYQLDWVHFQLGPPPVPRGGVAVAAVPSVSDVVRADMTDVTVL